VQRESVMHVLGTKEVLGYWDGPVIPPGKSVKEISEMYERFRKALGALESD
jgi:hypothetical protein